jgi:hypothetical protein
MSHQAVAVIAELVGGAHDGRWLEIVPNCRMIMMPDASSFSTVTYTPLGRTRTVGNTTVVMFGLSDPMASGQ